MIAGERIVLYPLEEADLRLLATNIHAFELKTGLDYEGEDLAGQELQEIMIHQADQIILDPNHWLWHTFWLMVVHGKAIVGSLCFKGPAKKGEVEIGYGVSENHQGHRYATEAVGMLCDWALTQNGVVAVLAETEAANLASIRVLEHNHFVFTHSLNEFHWWKKTF